MLGHIIGRIRHRSPSTSPSGSRSPVANSDSEDDPWDDDDPRLRVVNPKPRADVPRARVTIDPPRRRRSRVTFRHLSMCVAFHVSNHLLTHASMSAYGQSVHIRDVLPWASHVLSIGALRSKHRCPTSHAKWVKARSFFQKTPRTPLGWVKARVVNRCALAMTR